MLAAALPPHDEAIDFIRGDDGHAGLSLRKVAELLRVSPQAISQTMKSVNLFNGFEAETIAAQGFRGVNLVKLAKHFSQSRQTKIETKEHCLELLEKAAIIGVQTFIDRIAGISEVTQPQQPVPSPKSKKEVSPSPLAI